MQVRCWYCGHDQHVTEFTPVTFCNECGVRLKPDNTKPVERKAEPDDPLKEW